MVAAAQVKLVCAALLSCLACASGPQLKPRPTQDPLASVDAATLEARGRALLAAGDAIRAEQYLASAVARGASADRLMPELIALCLAGSRHRAALTYATRHLRRHPDDWALMNLVALLYHVVGEHDAAERYAAEAALLAPERPEPAYVRAMALTRLGRDAAAKKEMSRYKALRSKKEDR